MSSHLIWPENAQHAALGVQQQSVIRSIAEGLCREHDGV